MLGGANGTSGAGVGGGSAVVVCFVLLRVLLWCVVLCSVLLCSVLYWSVLRSVLIGREGGRGFPQS